MKTPTEWLKEIKHLSDTEARHGSSVFLLESDIQKIQSEAWNMGRISAFQEVKLNQSIQSNESTR